MADKDAVAKAVKAELQRLYGERLAKVILYGSYARGDAHEESDMDFLVVLKDEKIKLTQELSFMCDPLLRLSLQFGIAISNFPVTQKKLLDAPTMFYQQVRKEGVEL
jgi:predicted nucleotidyltransferase